MAHIRSLVVAGTLTGAVVLAGAGIAAGSDAQTGTADEDKPANVHTDDADGLQAPSGTDESDDRETDSGDAESEAQHDNHGAVVSQIAKAAPTGGREHGEIVSAAARTNGEAKAAEREDDDDASDSDADRPGRRDDRAHGKGRPDKED